MQQSLGYGGWHLWTMLYTPTSLEQLQKRVYHVYHDYSEITLKRPACQHTSLHDSVHGLKVKPGKIQSLPLGIL